MAKLFFLLAFFFLFIPRADSQVHSRDSGVVVADHELAAGAGMEVLQRGGNAVDAAVATAFALGVVDPASSGLGGGGFMVIYQAKEKKIHALDFRETAPAAAHRGLYIKGGKVVSSLSLTGALAVAVPGQVAGLAEALKRFGSLPLSELVAPATRYAMEGVPLKSHLRQAVERNLTTIRKSEPFSRVFLGADGSPREEGEKIVQQDLGETLKLIAQQGPQAFYSGAVAQAITGELKKEGGVITLADLAGYRPVWREPVIGRYRSYAVVTMPPPSSGGIALVQMLNVLEPYPLQLFRHNSPTYLHLVAESMKHAFSDRAHYLGDPDFVQVPLRKLISREYAAAIRKRIAASRTHPPEFYGFAATHEEKGGTTHFGVLDRDGNAVACTVTINTRFGSKVMAGRTGVILNNEMDDFAIQPSVPNVYGLTGNEANGIQPKKRPLSSMVPTIVLKGDRPVLIVGASGGPRIISATLQVALNVLDFAMPVKEAVEAPRIHHQWLPNDLAVEGGIPLGVREALERLGHSIKERRSLAVVQAIGVRGRQATGYADPRKAGRDAE